MILHDKGSHVASPFSYRDPRNAMVPLSVPLALFDAGSNGLI